jgi:hypothetical protein
MRTLSRTSPSSRAYHVKQKRDNFTVTTLFRAKRRSYIDMGRLPLSAISSEKGLSERHSSSARVAFVACGCPIWAKHVRGTAAVGGHVRGTGKNKLFVTRFGNSNRLRLPVPSHHSSSSPISFPRPFHLYRARARPSPALLLPLFSSILLATSAYPYHPPPAAPPAQTAAAYACFAKSKDEPASNPNMTQPQSARSSTLPRGPRPASTSQSGLSSPRSSRDPSPAGPSAPSAAAPTSNPSRGARSRKNSHDVSPQRLPNLPTPPSAAIIQRALANASFPALQPSTDPSSRLPRSQRTNGSGDPSKDTPSWPVSPRLKSPPPSSTARRSSSANRRKPADSAEPPVVLVHRASPEQTPESSRDAEANPPKSSTKASNVVSTLATVDESAPTTQDSPEDTQRYAAVFNNDRT